jgi:hypothetical protein
MPLAISVSATSRSYVIESLKGHLTRKKNFQMLGLIDNELFHDNTPGSHILLYRTVEHYFCIVFEAKIVLTSLLVPRRLSQYLR